MNKVKLILSVAFLSLTSLMFAQSMNEAGEAFNKAIAAVKANDYASAIKAYNDCISICKKLGEEGEELQIKAESQIPDAHFKMGIELYKTKKFDDAIKSFQKSSETALTINDAATSATAKNYIARVFVSKGSGQYKANDMTGALASFNKAIEADKTYFKAFYNKALVYNKQDNLAEFKKAMDKVIELGPASDKTVEAAKTTVFRTYRAEAGKSLQAGNFKQAIENVDVALKYDAGDAQTFYFATIAYNGLSNWQKAIETGNKALSLEQKNKSNIYFELGKAYEGVGNSGEACKAYKGVTDGPNKAAAQHKVTQELKCG